MRLCSCPRDALCDQCVKDTLAQMRGVAACRGEVWAMSVATRRPHLRTKRWPAHEGRAADIARRKVVDLGDDGRLRERLAEVVSTYAARWWGRR